MANFNKVILMGNLTRDPEKRYTRGDNPVTHFSVACNRNYTDRKTGEKKQIVSFIPVVVWGTQAENCAQYLQKGSPVFVEGRLASRSWETPQGDKRSRLEVVAQSIQFLRRAPQGEYNSASSDSSVKNSVETDILDEPPKSPSEDGDVPF